MSFRETQDILDISYRQAISFKKKFISNGLDGLLRRHADAQPNFKLTQEVIDFNNSGLFKYSSAKLIFPFI